MSIYIIALGIYLVLFVTSSYFTNKKFRKFIHTFFKFISLKFNAVKHSVLGNKAVVLGE